MFKHLIPISVILLTLLACGGNKTKQPNIEVTVESKRYEVITNIQTPTTVSTPKPTLTPSQLAILKTNDEIEAATLTPTVSPLSKYYSIPEVDPEWNQGVYLPRHCRFWGHYEGVGYDEIPILEVPFKEEHKKEFYSEAELLDFVDHPGPMNGTQKPGGGNIGCEADWEMLTHLESGLWKGEQAPRDL